MTSTRTNAVAALALGLTFGMLFTGCSGSPAETAGAAASAHSLGTSAAPTSSAPGQATSNAASTPRSASGSIQACGLVTEQEVRTAIGATPGAGQPFSSHGSTQCQFGTYQSGLVLVNMTPTQGVSAYHLVHKNPKLSQSGHVADLAGVGDRAFEITAPHTASIYFDKGDVLVLVTVETPKVAPPVAPVLALAKSAAGRI
jgi:hypothetical protein